jgi:glycosyltransferase involved in cell wall biosynthesis
MRIGIMSYPMLFQREGGLQVQVRATIGALNQLSRHEGEPMEVELVDPCRSRLDDYDLVHVFAATNGNHRIVEEAAELGVPVVLSPLISPGWNRASGTRARVADRLLGNLTDWNVQTSYAMTRRALQVATLVVALGEAEKAAIAAAFLIDPAKVRVFPHGIGAHFFTANPAMFRERTGITGPFVLMVGPIAPHKNQLGMAQALSELALPFVLAGSAAERDQDYLRQVRAVRGVTCLGPLRHEDRLLASAFAAAAVFALPSQSEVFPLPVLESLASGTPVVMTRDSALHLVNSEFALRKVQWNDIGALKRAVMGFIAEPPEPARVRSLVRDFTWQRVASDIAGCYADVLRRGVRAAA